MKTIELNGLLWDTENLNVDGKTHFAYEKAKTEVAKRGKRLPTKYEFNALLQLPHTFDTVKRGMWFAEKEEDLKSEKSLFLPAEGYSFRRSELCYIGTDGYYWSATPNGAVAYKLHFASLNINTSYSFFDNCFTVRCVSDMNKPEVMETNQEIEFKIPEGYVIDDSKSTKDKIVCKPIVIKYPKSWEDSFLFKDITGFYVEGSSIEHAGYDRCSIEDKSVLKTKKQAESALAYAQLTQLMALPCYNGDWVPNWDDPNQTRCCIARVKHDITKSDFGGYFYFLAFKSEKVRDAFFDNHIDLIKQFYQL